MRPLFKQIGAVVLGLVGLVWIGQGLNLLQGSSMTGQVQWAIIGAALLAVAVWLFWSSRRDSTNSP